MKRILSLLIVLCTMLPTTAWGYVYNEPHAMQNILESARMNTVSITAIQYGERYANWVKSGSGAFLQNGYVLTANHVIEGSNDIEILSYTGERYTAEIIKKDLFHDIAVLRIQTPVEGFRVSSAELYNGDAVLTVGQPTGLPTWSYSEGMVTNTAKECRLDGNVLHMVTSDNQVMSGNSGGPMVDAKGELAGILVGSSVQTGEALSVSLKDIKAFLSDVGMGYLDVDTTYE